MSIFSIVFKVKDFISLVYFNITLFNIMLNLNCDLGILRNYWTKIQAPKWRFW